MAEGTKQITAVIEERLNAIEPGDEYCRLVNALDAVLGEPDEREEAGVSEDERDDQETPPPAHRDRLIAAVAAERERIIHEEHDLAVQEHQLADKRESLLRDLDALGG